MSLNQYFYFSLNFYTPPVFKDRRKGNPVETVQH